jgi:hypothetical protein
MLELIKAGADRWMKAGAHGISSVGSRAEVFKESSKM